MKNSRIYFSIIAISLVILSSCGIEDPNFDERDDFTGEWTCNEQSSIYPNSNYQIYITKHSTDTTKILIGNFYQLGTVHKATAIVTGTSLSIPNQTLDGHTIFGSGNLVGNDLNLSYSVNDGSATDNCTATCIQ